MGTEQTQQDPPQHWPHLAPRKIIRVIHKNKCVPSAKSSYEIPRAMLKRKIIIIRIILIN